MPSDERLDNSAPAHGPSCQSNLEAPSPSGGKKVLSALVLALVGGGLTWVVLWGFYPVATVPPELATATSLSAPPDDVARAMALSRRATLFNPVFALGVLGALLGATLALAAGSASAGRSRMLAAIGVAIVGAGFGAAAGAVTCVLSKVKLPDSVEWETIKFVVLHVAALTLVGCGVGLGVGILARRWRGVATGLGAGTLGGALAGLLYSTLAAVLLPQFNAAATVPSGAIDRMVWTGVASVSIGLIVAKFTPAPATTRA
jgi:hypothetical protein